MLLIEELGRNSQSPAHILMKRLDMINDANPAPPISMNFNRGKKTPNKNSSDIRSCRTQNWTTRLFKIIILNLIKL